MSNLERVRAHVSMNISEIYPNVVESEGLFIISIAPAFAARLIETGAVTEGLPSLYLTVISEVKNGIPNTPFLYEVIAALNLTTGPNKLIVVKDGDVANVSLTSTVPADDLQKREFVTLFAMHAANGETIPAKLFEALATNRLPG